jgi:uncharacterized protein (TIGR02271 family)
MPRRERVAIPVVAEELAVEKREHPTERVRVRKHVIESEVRIDLVSAREDVDIERVPVGRIVESMPEARVEGNTTVVPVVEETVIVEKRLLLKEEIRITKRRSEEKRSVNVPVKSEQADIERELVGNELRRREP